MKKFKSFINVISVFMILTMIFCSCGSSKDSEKSNELLDISSFTIIREDKSSKDVTAQTVLLKKYILAVTGLSLTVRVDYDVPEIEGAKEILIGQTDRSATKNALKKLAEKDISDGYIIDISDNYIVIVGTSDYATVRAIKVFKEKYVSLSPEGNSIVTDAGREIIEKYNSENVIHASGGIELEIEVISSICEPSNEPNKDFYDKYPLIIKGAQYPAITELCHQPNEKDNGKLIAIFSLNADAVGVKVRKTAACVAMSEDGGESWKCIARPEEKISPELSEGSMAHIYELPAAIGDMPAGTLLYSANSVDYSYKSNISVWRSFDAGHTWEQYVCIASAGGLREGVWEPFMIYSEEDGYLYCFYSDDSDPKHDQKIVYKRSKDGVNWSDSVDVVAYSNFAYRPGMPVITKMGNGEYFLVFEMFGDWRGCPIFYKTTKDLSNWGDPNDYGTKIADRENQMNATPCCAWIPAGSENGTLIVTAKSTEEYIFASFDYGRNWEMIKNPLPFYEFAESNGRIGYSAGLWVGSDGKTLYYINVINATSAPDSKSMAAFAKIKIY